MGDKKRAASFCPDDMGVKMGFVFSATQNQNRCMQTTELNTSGIIPPNT
jgi:hypothetical protein